MIPAGHQSLPMRLVAVVLPVLLLGSLPGSFGAAPARAGEPPAVPGAYDTERQPPLRMGRMWTARRIPARVLHVGGEWEWSSHNAMLSSRSEDPQLAALGDAAVQTLLFDLIYGLGADVSVRARLGWLRLQPGEGTLVKPGGGGVDGDSGSPIAGAALGFGDIETAVTYSPAIRERLYTRFEAGLTLPTGSDILFVPDGGTPLAPFTADARQVFLSAAGRTRLTGDGAAVDIDLHVAGVYQYRAAPPSGLAFAPYPVRIPLLGLVTDGRAYDRLDFQAAFSLTRGSAAFFAVLDWPLLQDSSDYLLAREAPRALTPGVQLALGSRLAMTASMDVFFHTDDYTTEFDALAAYPEWGLRIRLGTDMVPVDRDRDGDGIGDRSDRCPDTAEDLDGFADEDGCPEFDNDQDGVSDALDACPDESEDVDGFQDEDGCPDPDNDQDGVADQFDGCPVDAEDVDGFKDDDGCPDPDNDQDGIPDVDDACPDQIPGRGGDADGDGCPD